MTVKVQAYRIPRPPLPPVLPDDVPLALRTWVENVVRYLVDTQAQTQTIFLDLNQGRQRIALPFQLPEFQASALIAALNPRPNPPGRIVYCADDSAGECLAVSDGTDWRKLTLGGVIS